MYQLRQYRIENINLYLPTTAVAKGKVQKNNNILYKQFEIKQAVATSFILQNSEK